MKRRIYVYATLLPLLLLAAVAFWGVQEYTASGPLAAPKTLIFKHGMHFGGIADQLGDEGVIENPLYFKAAALITLQAKRFKAGEYAFPAGASVHDIIAMLAGGKVVIHKLTVAEGLNVRQISALLMAEPALTGELPPDIAEGSLLPETYHFTYGDTRAELVDRMQQGMRDALEAAWEKRKDGLPYASPHDALVMASIIEKETGAKSERGRVAAVYVNRLKRGMLLQADPTVTYGIEVAQGAEMKRQLTLADLRTPSPYNTYLNTGLPPTPIANPGRAAIAAALNPADTDDLYFVADGHGGHNFAATMKEHERNVAAYRKAEARR